MMRRLAFSEHDRRVLLVGILLVGAIASLRLVPSYVRAAHALRARADLARVQVLEQRTLASQAPALSRAAAQVQGRLLAFAPAFVSGDTPPTASAALASHVSSVARSAGVALGTLDVRADSDTSDIGQVMLRGEATADVRALTTFLAALEAGAPVLDVRELSVSQPAPGGPDNQVEALHVGFTVRALAHYRPRTDQ